MTQFARMLLGAGLAAVVIAVTAPPVDAQPTFDLELLNGGKPVPDAQILFLLGEGKISLGETGADGRLEIPMDRVDIGKGTEVVACEIECDGEITMVFVLPEEAARFDEECELRRRENPECDCRRIGVFRWGEHLVVDVETRTVERVQPPDDTPPPEQTPEGVRDDADPRRDSGQDAGMDHPLRIGLGFDLRHMFRLEEVLGGVEGVGDHGATTFAPGIRLHGEYSLLGLVALGLEAGWSRMNTEAGFATGVQTGKLDYYEVGFTARVGPGEFGPVSPYLALGLYRTWNEADFTLGDLTEHRSHVTRRDGLGLGFDYWVGDRLGVRAEGLYSSTFKESDADEHIRWNVGLVYRPLPRISF